MAPRTQLAERVKELHKDESWMAQIKETKEWVEQLQLEVENQKREYLPVQTVDDVIDNARYAEEVLKANGKYYNATEMAKLLGAKSAAALNIELQNSGIILQDKRFMGNGREVRQWATICYQDRSKER